MRRSLLHNLAGVAAVRVLGAILPGPNLYHLSVVSSKCNYLHDSLQVTLTGYLLGVAFLSFFLFI